jgi:hypothetical protein
MLFPDFAITILQDYETRLLGKRVPRLKSQEIPRFTSLLLHIMDQLPNNVPYCSMHIVNEPLSKHNQFSTGFIQPL